MSSYRDVIQQARKQENQNTSIPAEPESQHTSMPETREPEVNLSIKVPRALRRHWVSEAKRQDTSLTAAIIEALKARFGEPA